MVLHKEQVKEQKEVTVELEAVQVKLDQLDKQVKDKAVTVASVTELVVLVELVVKLSI